MSYAPACYLDDEDSDYDGLDYEPDYVTPGSNTISDVKNKDDITWPNPRNMAAPTAEDFITISQDFHRFISLVVENDVEGVAQCLELNKSLLDQSFENSFLTISSGGTRIIFIACSKGHFDMISMLLDRGVSLEPNANDRLTPLMSICSAVSQWEDKQVFEARLLKCAELILKTGKVDVNARQNHRLTALMFAAKQGYDSLVKFLIESGADLDAVDTQLWTALTFAVDAGYGNVARRLLEAGANPDIATLDGPLPIDIAYSRNLIQLGDIIKAFASRERLPVVETSSDETIIQKYSDLDTILLGLDAADYVSLFRKQRLSLEHFLELTESDLEKIGVDKIGVRKKIVQGIVEIHKKDFEQSSLPKILPKDRRNGIFITCPDAILQIANVGQHFRFISANIQFIKRQIKDKPELLLIGKDMADVSHLLNRIHEARKNLNVTSKQLRDLEGCVSDACSKLGLECQPVDRIDAMRRPQYVKYTLSFFGIFSAFGVAFYFLKKRSL